MFFIILGLGAFFVYNTFLNKSNNESPYQADRTSTDEGNNKDDDNNKTENNTE